MDVAKTVRLSQLYDFYGPLLTQRQRLVFQRYYHDDLSLGEISEEFQITRQAVFDVLRRCEKALESFEAKLGLLARHQRERALLSEMEEELARLGRLVGAEAVSPLRAHLARWREEAEAVPEAAGAGLPGDGGHGDGD